MGKVRQAGYLFQKDKDTYSKHWCVVRDKSFIVYPCQPKIKNIRADTDGSPIYVLPVDDLSISKFVAPKSSSGSSSKSSLQLYSAASDTRLLFYIDRVEALEKWIHAIKAEVEMDDLAPQITPQGAPLPPELNSDSIPLSPSPTQSKMSSFGKEISTTKYYGDFKSAEFESPNAAKDTNKRKNKKLLKAKAVSSTTSECPEGVTCSSTLPSSMQLMTPSPRLTPKINKKQSFSRQLAISPAHKRTKNNATAPGHHKSSIAADYHATPMENHTIPETSVAHGKRSAALYGTVSQTTLNKLLPSNHDAVKRSNSSKRHTICEVPDSDFAIQDELQLDLKSKSTATAIPPTKTKSNRYSIAPLSSLDLRLRQKKKTRKSLWQYNRAKSEERSSRKNSNASSDEDEQTMSSIQQSSLDSSLGDDRGNSTDDFRSRDLNVILRQHQLESGGLNQSLPDLHKAQETLPMEEVWKPSENIGPLELKRVSSAREQRKKSEDVEKVSAPYKFLLKTSAERPKTMAELTSPQLGVVSSNIMQGWLYRRKMMTWNKLWAVLSADKMMRFYKSNRNPHHSEPLLTLNLEKGFAVENIIQDKSFNSFWLRPKSTAIDRVSDSSLKEEMLAKSWVKPIQLLCKSTQDFMHWMKEFLLLNSKSFGERKTFLPHPKHASHTAEPLTIKNSDLKTTGIDEYNNNSKLTPVTNTILTTFQTENSSEGKCMEEETKEPMFHDRESNCSLDVPSLADEKPVFHSAGPTIKVTFCDGNTSDVEGQENQLDTKFSEKSGKLVKREKGIFEEDILLEKNIEKNSNKNKTSDLAERAQTTVDRIESQTKVSVPETNSFSLVQQNSVLAVTSPQSKSLHSLSSKSAGAIDNNSVPGEKTGKGYQVTGQENELSSCEKQITNNLNFQDNASLHEVSVSKNNGIEKQKEIRDCKFADGHVPERTRKICDNNLEFDDVKRREIENEIASFSTDAISKKTLSPFFSRPVDSEKPSLHAMSVADGVAAIEERCLVSVVGRKPTKRSLDLPKVIERIKLFESFAAATIPDDGIDVANNEKTEIVPSEISSAKSGLNLENCINFTVDNSGPRKFSSVEDLRNTSSKGKSFLTLPDSDLRRATSDSNLVDINSRELFKMRRGRNPIPQLSQIDFIEIFGVPKSLNSSQDQFLGIDDIPMAKRRNSVESDDNSLPTKDLSEDNSITSLVLGSKANALESNHNTPHRRIESESGTSGSSHQSDPKTGWRIHGTVKLRKKPGRSGDSFKKTSSREQVLQLPASQIITASHRGYLQKRSKKRHWDKFWCVFQDACLYFYNSPHSDATRDVIVLRGYEVVADVTNANREKFEFRLQQEGSRTLHFCTDNFEDFLLWVGTLEKETKSIRSTESRKNSNMVDNLSEKNELSSDAFHPSSSGSSSAPSPMLTRSFSHDRLEMEIVEMQKHKLLKELATQQEKLREEQRVLDKFCGCDSLQQSQEQLRLNATKRQELMRKFDIMREQEEAKVTKTMAFLNCRRNSAQLKLDQIAKELAPKSGKKRRDDHKYFAALEAKQAEMKIKLAKVDREIYELQVMKQSAFDKLQERQDLALILSDQQENIDILTKTSAVEPQHVRRRHKSNPARKGLSSIDEVKRGSDASTSSDSGSDEHKISRSKLTAFGEKRSGSPPVFDDLTKEVHPLTILRSLSSDVNFKDYGNIQRSYSSDDGLSKNPTSLSSSLFSLGSSTEFLQSSSSNHRRNKSEIDPSVIAGIEDFEKFSAKMLEKVKRKSKSSS